MEKKKVKGLIGTVVSDANDKTVNVLVETYEKDPIYGKRILEALLSQVLQEPVDILEYISSIKNNEYIIVETNNAILVLKLIQMIILLLKD